MGERTSREEGAEPSFTEGQSELCTELGDFLSGLEAFPSPTIDLTVRLIERQLNASRVGANGERLKMYLAGTLTPHEILMARLNPRQTPKLPDAALAATIDKHLEERRAVYLEQIAYGWRVGTYPRVAMWKNFFVYNAALQLDLGEEEEWPWAIINGRYCRLPEIVVRPQINETGLFESAAPGDLHAVVLQDPLEVAQSLQQGKYAADNTEELLQNLIAAHAEQLQIASMPIMR